MRGTVIMLKDLYQNQEITEAELAIAITKYNLTPEEQTFIRSEQEV